MTSALLPARGVAVARAPARSLYPAASSTTCLAVSRSPRAAAMRCPRLSLGGVPRSYLAGGALLPSRRAVAPRGLGRGGDLVVAMGKEVESEKIPKDIRDRTLFAIDKLGQRVTVGDVAATAGLKNFDAERAVQAIATDTGANLQVSETGEVLYNFPRNVRGALSKKSSVIRMEPALQKAQAAAAYLIRVSFGTALVASVVIVYAAIFALMSQSSSSDRDRRDRGYGGGGMGFRPGFYISPSDIFWYMDPYYMRNRRQRRARGEGMNFLEAVFSFVFGDGDPNEDFDARRWREVGSLIQRKGGVVTAEQLAPYLDPPAPRRRPDESWDESFVVPVLQRFDGSPEVDEEGNLLYRFPSLQVLMAAGLGLANLVGVLVLGNMLSDPYAVRSMGYGVVKLASQLYPFLEAYAYSFFVIPLARWLLNKRKNATIDDRNTNRMRSQVALERPDRMLSAKIASARAEAKREVVTEDQIVYESNRNVDDQAAFLASEAEDFDRRLRGLDGDSGPGRW